MSGDVLKAGGRTVKLLREDLEKISAKVTEIKDELRTISQKSNGDQDNTDRNRG